MANHIYTAGSTDFIAMASLAHIYNPEKTQVSTQNLENIFLLSINFTDLTQYLLDVIYPITSLYIIDIIDYIGVCIRFQKNEISF
jgi:hypothetical protein